MTSHSTLADEWAALTAGKAGRPIVRDVFSASGPDAVSFLHGQLSQDVASMEVDETRRSFLLQPNGRVIAVLRLTRESEDSLLIDTDAGVGVAARSALARFLIRTKCVLGEVRTLSGARLPEGPLLDSVVDRVVDTVVDTDAGSRAAPLYRLSATPFNGVDVLWDELPADPAFPLVSAETGSAWSVATGEPVPGVDLTDSTLPSETGLIDAAVKFGKGCYVGQELVERIDSRGRVVRVMARLRSDAPMPFGAAVIHDGIEVGTVGSNAATPDGFVAIALLRSSAVPSTDESAHRSGEPTSVVVQTGAAALSPALVIGRLM
jgi:tRNA-modifying protein YgfZ